MDTHIYEIIKRYFWHNMKKKIHMIVKACKQRQLMKRTRNICCDITNLKNISIYDLLYLILLNIIDPLLEAKIGNKYIFELP